MPDIQSFLLSDSWPLHIILVLELSSPIGNESQRRGSLDKAFIAESCNCRKFNTVEAFNKYESDCVYMCSPSFISCVSYSRFIFYFFEGGNRNGGMDCLQTFHLQFVYKDGYSRPDLSLSRSTFHTCRLSQNDHKEQRTVTRRKETCLLELKGASKS